MQNSDSTQTSRFHNSRVGYCVGALLATAAVSTGNRSVVVMQSALLVKSLNAHKRKRTYALFTTAVSPVSAGTPLSLLPSPLLNTCEPPGKWCELWGASPGVLPLCDALVCICVSVCRPDWKETGPSSVETMMDFWSWPLSAPCATTPLWTTMRLFTNSFCSCCANWMYPYFLCFYFISFSS